MTEVDVLLPRKNFDLKIRETFSPGITGIFGPSGSGKTSLLQAIAGLEKPLKGFITVSGRTLFDSSRNINVPVENRNIGYVFQEGRLFPHMDIRKNLMYGWMNNRSNKIGFDEVVDLLQLDGLLDSKPGSISGGERQRVALGRSLLSSPDILLLDEPFSAVDIRLRKQILPFILRIQRKVNIPVLVVSHDLPDLLRLTNKLIIIDEGYCLGHGEYHDLLRIPQISNFFGDKSLVNSLTVKVKSSSSESDLTLLAHPENPEVVIKCNRSSEEYRKEQEVRIFIDADDIALSNRKLKDITIQNQIPGTVTDLIARGSTLLCIVNSGFELVVEITVESQKRMEIKKGSKVWCLFKSVAIDVAG